MALLLVLSGCGWFAGDSVSTAQPPSPAPVEAEPPPEPVEVLGVPGEVEVGDAQAPTDPGGGLYFVSQLYPVSGPRLEQPVLVRMVLDGAVPAGTALAVAARDEDDGPWEFLEARLDTDGRHVEFITSELSTFGVLAVDSDTVRASWTGALDNALARDAARPAGVEPPTCENAAQAREDDYRARGWKRTTLGWCFDQLGDQRLLRVTNLRGVPVRVTVPGAEDEGLTGDQARGRIAWTTWIAALGAGTPGSPGQEAPGVDLAGTDTFVPPGRTLSVGVDLEPGTTLVLTATDDERGRAVQLLHALARASSDQVRRFGVAEPDPEQVFTAWAAMRPCARALDRTGDAVAATLVQGCLGERGLRRAFDSAALLLAPVLSDIATSSSVAERLTTLSGGAESVEQRIQVRRDEPDFSALVGSFSAAGRTLGISETGLVTESVSLDGRPVVTMTYQLSEPSGERARARATATLRSVEVTDRRLIQGSVPTVGSTGTLTSVRGVVASPFLPSSYCSTGARKRCAAQDAQTSAQTNAETGSQTGAPTSAATGPRPRADAAGGGTQAGKPRSDGRGRDRSAGARP